MKYFRSFVAFMLAAVMLLSAYALAGSTVIYRQDYENGDYFSINSAVYRDGVLYMSDYGSEIRTWTGNSDELSIWSIPDDVVEIDSEEGYASFRKLIGGDDGIYALYEVVLNDDESYMFDHMLLFKATINGEELVFDTEPYELDWDGLVEEYDDYSYANDIRSAYIEDGKLIGLSYDANYSDVVVVIDIEDDDMELYEVQNVVAACAYTEGRMLVVTHTYDESVENPTMLCVVDLSTGETEELGAMESMLYEYPSMLAYDRDDDVLYYTLNGELVCVPGLDLSNAMRLCAVNVNSWSDFSPVVTDDNKYICGDYETVVICDTDPSQRSETTLYVYGGYDSAMDRAQYSFAAGNPGVEVVQLDAYEDLTQAMLSQSSAVDIYTVSVSYQEYDAVFNRGYMAELDESSIITDYVYSIYPAMQQVLIHDGHVVAVPLDTYAYSMSYNPEAFEALGISDRVPTTWIEFVQLLNELPEIIGDSGYYVFEPYYTVDDARNSLVYEIIDSYMLCLQQDGAEFKFNTPELREVLAAVEEVDFAALGLNEDYDEDVYDWDYNKILFTTYGSVSCEAYILRDGSSRPMPLAFGDNPASIACHMTVAFVNPYSDNRELAIAYLENAVAEISGAARVKFCPGYNEPQENYYYAESLASYDESIASAEQQRDAAEDEETRAMWQEQIDYLIEYRADYEANYRWDVSEESIAFYRNYGDILLPKEYMGFDAEVSTEFYTLMDRYMTGNIDLDTFLNEIDGKIRMMVLEDM